jgi:hypothetical protein
LHGQFFEIEGSDGVGFRLERIFSVYVHQFREEREIFSKREIVHDTKIKKPSNLEDFLFFFKSFETYFFFLAAFFLGAAFFFAAFFLVAIFLEFRLVKMGLQYKSNNYFILPKFFFLKPL